MSPPFFATTSIDPVGTGRRAFTMIELLIVIGIMILLASMAMPMLSIVRRSANRANTENLLRKVETALESFRKDIRAYPYLAVDATAASSISPQDAADPWRNDLGMRLARDMDDTERGLLQQDLAAVRAIYTPGAATAIKDTDIDETLTKGKWTQATEAVTKTVIAAAVNRLSAERAMVGVLSGNIGICRTVKNGAPSVWSDGAAVLATPKSTGFGADYLGSEVQPKELLQNAGKAQALVDAFGTPLIYLNPTVNGVLPFTMQGAYGPLKVEWYHLDQRGRQETRILASDARTTAAGDYRFTYEVWSAGPDRLFDARRTQASNRDNISISRYLKGLE